MVAVSFSDGQDVRILGCLGRWEALPPSLPALGVTRGPLSFSIEETELVKVFLSNGCWPGKPGVLGQSCLFSEDGCNLASEPHRVRLETLIQVGPTDPEVGVA